MKPSIYRYHHYQSFLNDWFEWKKTDNTHFSHRAFAMRAHLPSHNYLMRIMHGTRTLSEEYLPMIAEGMQLTADEKAYLSLLLQLEKEQSSEQKTALFRQLLTLRKKHVVVQLEGDQLLFYAKWYYPLVWELVVLPQFSQDFTALGKHCIPALSRKEVSSAVKALIAAGLLKERSDGHYTHISPTVTTGDEISASIVRNYHRQQLLKSADMLDLIPREERDISSVTVSVSKESFHKMKALFQQYRKQLLEIAAADTSSETVYLASFQLLPQTKWESHHENIS